MNQLVVAVRRIYLGWWVVWGTMLLQVMLAALFGNVFGLYTVSLTNEFGWSLTLVAAGYSLIQMQSGILAPLQGFLLDRFGPRAVITVGVLAFGSGLLLLGQTTSLLGFYTAMIAVGIGLAFAGYLSHTTCIVAWFRARRTLALSLMSMGFSLGGLLVPVVAWSMLTFGWQATATASGLLAFIFGLPLSRLMFRGPEHDKFVTEGDRRYAPSSETDGVSSQQAPLKNDFSLHEALRTRAFWLLGIGHGSVLLVVAAMAVHLIPHLTQGQGLSLTSAASVVALLTFTTAATQATTGWIGDRFSKRNIAVISMGMQASGLFALVWLPGMLALGVFIALHGIAWGVLGPLVGAMRADYFGLRHFGAIAGFSTLIHMLGQLLGPLSAGVLVDQLGDYRLAFSALGGLAAFGMLAFYFATPPKPKKLRD